MTDPLLAAGHLPFALAGSGDPVCFDTTRRHPDRDAPIVRIDPEEIRGTSNVRVVAEISAQLSPDR